MDVVVGLRQLHFLAKYWETKRGYELSKDLLADELFPFISLGERLTLKQFFRKPCHCKLLGRIFVLVPSSELIVFAPRVLVH